MPHAAATTFQAACCVPHSSETVAQLSRAISGQGTYERPKLLLSGGHDRGTASRSPAVFRPPPLLPPDPPVKLACPKPHQKASTPSVDQNPTTLCGAQGFSPPPLRAAPEQQQTTAPESAPLSVIPASPHGSIQIKCHDLWDAWRRLSRHLHSSGRPDGSLQLLASCCCCLGAAVAASCRTLLHLPLLVPTRPQHTHRKQYVVAVVDVALLYW